MSGVINWLTNVILAICFGCKQFSVVIVSMMPIVELRGGIPVGVRLGLPLWESFLWAFVGSSIICVPLLLLFSPFFAWVKEKGGIGKIFARVEAVFTQKAGWFGIWGVFVLAMMPIPGTGVWTSSIVAVILGFGFFKSMLAIVTGNLVAGGWILLLTAVLGEHNLDTFLFILFILFVILLAWFVYKVFTVNNGTTKANDSGRQSGRNRNGSTKANAKT